ncbi:hypothetical protein EON63_14335, partial [archaeon]
MLDFGYTAHHDVSAPQTITIHNNTHGKVAVQVNTYHMLYILCYHHTQTIIHHTQFYIHNVQITIHHISCT